MLDLEDIVYDAPADRVSLRRHVAAFVDARGVESLLFRVSGIRGKTDAALEVINAIARAGLKPDRRIAEAKTRIEAAYGAEAASERSRAAVDVCDSLAKRLVRIGADPDLGVSQKAASRAASLGSGSLRGILLLGKHRVRIYRPLRSNRLCRRRLRRKQLLLIGWADIIFFDELLLLGGKGDRVRSRDRK